MSSSVPNASDVAAPLRALLLRSEDFEPELEVCLNASLATTIILSKRASAAAQLTFAGPWRLPYNLLRGILVLNESTLGHSNVSITVAQIVILLRCQWIAVVHLDSRALPKADGQGN